MQQHKIDVCLFFSLSGKEVKKLQGSIASDCVLRTGGECAVAAGFQSVRVEKKRKAGRMSPIQNATATGLTPSSSEEASLGTSVVEHIVLFKVKEDIVPEKKDEIFKSLQGLKKLDGVLHLTAEPVLSVKSFESTLVHHNNILCSLKFQCSKPFSFCKKS